MVEDTSSPPVFAQGGTSLQTYRTDVHENVAQTYERLGGSLHIIQYYDKNSLYTMDINMSIINSTGQACVVDKYQNSRQPNSIVFA